MGSGGCRRKSSAGRGPGLGCHKPEHATSKGVVRAQDVTCGDRATRARREKVQGMGRSVCEGAPEHATSKGVVRAQDVTCGKEK